MTINPMAGSNAYSGMKARPPIPKAESAYDEGFDPLDPTTFNGGIKPSAKMDLINALGNGTYTGGFNPQSVGEYNDHLRNNVASAMANLGFSLDDDEKLTIGIGADNLIAVSGFKDEAKSAALAEKLNTARAVSINGTKDEYTKTKNLYDGTFYINSDYANEVDDFTAKRDRADLIRLKNTANDSIKAMTGVELDIGALYRDDTGAVQGYPPELGWIFTGGYDHAPQDGSDKERYATATAVNSIVNRLLDAGYDNIPRVGDLDVSFTYGKNDLGLKPSLDTQA